jgi:predicted RND superfamily exporter protein
MIPDAVADRFGRWVTSHPWRVIILSTLLVLAAASGGRFIQFTTDYRVFFSDDNPQLKAFDQVENTYTKSDNVLFVLTPADGEVFTRSTLAAVKDLTDRSWQIPHSIRVDSITNFQHSYAKGDDLTVRDLVPDPDALGEGELLDIKRIALNEPLLVNQAVAPNAKVAGINVTIQLPGIDQMAEVPEVVHYVRQLAAEFTSAHPDIDVKLTGIAMLNNAFSEASQADMTMLVPISFLVIIVSIGLLLRGWTGTISSVWIIILSILTAMGLTGWLGIKLTPPSASAPIVIMTMAVADVVHVLVTFFHNARHGLAKRAAMVDSLRVNLQPIFLTSLTTAIGFMSMNFSDAPPFRDLGNIVAMGVGAAFVLSVTLLPALIMVLPVRVKPSPEGRTSAMERFAEFVIQYRKGLLIGVGALIVMLIAFIPRNELNDVYVEYFDHSIPFRVATDYANDNLAGLYRVDYSLSADESGAVSDPDFLHKVDEFAKWYRAQPETISVNTYTDIMKRLNKNMHGDDAAYYRLPERRDLAAQYLLLYEMSLPYGLDLNNQINVDKSATRLNISIHTISVNELLALEQRAQDWLAVNAPELKTEGTGPSMMFSHIGRRNIKSMLVGTTVALVLISLILIVALRSLKMGLVSLVPNLVPAAMAFGAWGLLVGEVGLSLSIVTGMTLGIVVDDTVHFLSKYLRARRERGLTPPDAVRYAFKTVGTALWVTSIVLMAGFMILALSAFKLNAGMGLLTSITIGLALLADFLFLPPLLMKLEEKSNEKTVDNNSVAKPVSA